MKQIKRSEMKVMPWKNGLGTTTEIMVFPERSSIQDLSFLWRLSQAEIQADAPFSAFEGYDRKLVVLTQPGLNLVRDGSEVKEHLAQFNILHFRGEESIIAMLPDGRERALDLGVIYRRDRVEAAMSVLCVPAGASIMLPLAIEFQTHIFFGIRGRIELRNAGKGAVSVEVGEAVILDKGAPRRGGFGASSVALISCDSQAESYVALVALSVRGSGGL